MTLLTTPRICLLAGLLVVSACSSSVDISQRNPNFVGVKFADGVMTGAYNPAGFTPRVLQNQISAICNGENLTDYREQAGENGLVNFSARCANGSRFTRAFMEVEKMPNGLYSVEITGS